MKKFYTLITLACCLSFFCNAQIRLHRYKCKYHDELPPNTLAELYSKADTFLFRPYSRDILDEIDDEDPRKMLAAGLELCFGKSHYVKTKDSLYIYTGTYTNPNIFYYEIYDPNHQASISVRSKSNDSVFSERSKWLLSQIRLHRMGDIYLINEKGETCQSQDEDEH